MSDSENKNPEKVASKSKNEDKYQRLCGTLMGLVYLIAIAYTPLPPEWKYRFALLGVGLTGGYTSWKTIQNLKEGK